jgi:quercetin dioxygenase-like cupin family protein
MAERQHGSAETRDVPKGGYVLGPAEGQYLFLNNGNVFLKVDPTTGCNSLAMGTQQVPASHGIPIHKHSLFDEAFYVLEGSGTFILEDRRLPIGKGSVIYIPKDAWHGFETAGDELLLLWIVAPPGLDAFFRDIGSTPGEPPAPPLSLAELNDIGSEYGTYFRT